MAKRLRLPSPADQITGLPGLDLLRGITKLFPLCTTEAQPLAGFGLGEPLIVQGRIRMIVGLGNPGDEYVGTRHNVGFEVLDCLAAEWGLFFESPRVLEGFDGLRKFSVLSKGHTSDSTRALCVKPTTFMNLSGTVVAPLAKWASLEPEDILVVYDDMDLPFGSLRIRPHGGHGGHNGMRSISECLDTDRFPRLRVGIGRSRTDAARHVLERFGPKEQEELKVVVAEAAEAIAFWADGGSTEECMTRFHSRWNQAPL